MPGNSARKGAVRKRGKGIGSGNTAGSGGRVRRGLEGKGPTPKAEDRPYHKAYRKRRPDEPGKTQSGQGRGGGTPRARTATRSGDDWVIGRNPVLEALQAGLPVKR
ncbi:MAG TPA: 23S rRNA (guanosine(2251)-2'-O)-methyltransferase RlmB, partial [Micropruina sp.]|nr:23S rRNA (guanosine(2251)-2'-O)-methyltransferase RlmB [Micropruina sp.]